MKPTTTEKQILDRMIIKSSGKPKMSGKMCDKPHKDGFKRGTYTSPPVKA